MLKNYLISALRNLNRNKGFTAINIFGLATGLTVCLLITMYVGHEWSYDRFHEKINRIYRLNVKETSQGKTSQSPVTSPAMGADIKNRIPEVESMVRFGYFGGDFKYNDKSFTENNLLTADSTLWEIFSFKLLKGDTRSALTKPFSIVLSENLARKFFGTNDAVGKTLDYNNGSLVFTVTGIVEDVPANSSIKYNGFVSFQTLYNIRTGTLTEWDGNFSFQTFLLVNKDFDLASLSAKMIKLADEIINPKLSQFNVRLEPTLQPANEIHLFTNLEYDNPGVAKTLYVFTAVALFVLFIAGFNFVNLSTAQSSKRAKEVGIRIISGSQKKQIIVQHLGETLVLCIISGLIALLVVELLMPIYNNLLGLKLSLYQANFWWLRLSLPIFVVFFGFLAGLYPAFFLTSFNPVNVLKSDLGLKKGKSLVRNTLVTLQFVVSTVLIICTSIIFIQINFLQTKNLGINTNNLIAVDIVGKNAWDRAERFKVELEKLPEIESVSYATESPGGAFTQNGYIAEGIVDPVMIRALGISKEYVRNLQITILQGRDFSNDLLTDSNSVLINETLVKQLGWVDPVGKKITREKEFRVIGVIKDFHFRSMHNAIEPLIMFQPFGFIKEYWNPVVHIRAKEVNSKDVISKVRNIWDKTQGETPMTVTYIGDIYKSHYRSEKNFGRLFIYFSLIAIIISCLGLLGLASFNMKTRTREVSIRKVMGSSTTNLIKILSIDFTKWALLANLFAWPAVWFFMDRWLNNFPYRIEIPWWIFILTGIVLYAISLLTILYQVYKTIRINPAQTLKYE